MNVGAPPSPSSYQRTVARLVASMASTDGAVRLREALLLADGFEVDVVTCETPRVADALVMWLAAELSEHRGRAIEVARLPAKRMPHEIAARTTDDLAESVLARLASVGADPTAREWTTLTIIDATSARSDEREVWRWLFNRLNERRNQIARIVPGPLLILTPVEFANDLPIEAPDLWSVRSVSVTVADPTRVEVSTVARLDATRPHSPVGFARVEELVESVSDLRDTDKPRALAAMASMQRQLAEIETGRGEFESALGRLRKALEIDQYLGDERGVAMTWDSIAEIHALQGHLDEALRIRREEQLPYFEKTGDVHAHTVTLSRIADVLFNQGMIDEALRLRRDEILPVYVRLGEDRSRAVTLFKIATALIEQGHADAALRILRDEVLPVFQHLGDEHARALALGVVADVLQTQGRLDEALRSRREEQLPVFERLGAVREIAVTKSRIADGIATQGDLETAIAMYRDEIIPAFLATGDMRNIASTRADLAVLLARQGHRDEATMLWRDALASFPETTHPRDRAFVLSGMADALTPYDRDEALRLAREALALLESTGHEQRLTAARERVRALESS